MVRLLAIARTLARHDCLERIADLAPMPGAFPLLRRLAGRPDPALAVGRPGERLARALESLGPSFIKLGQALSVRADLVGEDMARDLGALRDRLAPFAGQAARAAVAQELGRPVAELYASFDDQAIAAASIAQVHFATLAPSATEVSDLPEPRPVAVKILRPGVEAAFQRDLALFFWLARLVERFQPAARRLRPVEVVETVRDSVAIEMDLRLEAAAASELAETFAADPGYRVPAVIWDRTARRVLTLDRVAGIPIDDLEALDQAGHDRPALARALIQVFLNQALRDGFFHADMHHGNLFVAPDGALVAVDFGIMGRLDRATRLFMAELLYAFVQGDYRRAAEVHFAAGYVPATKSVEAFAQACRAIGEPILGRPVSEISIGRLLAQLFQVTATFDMRTQPQLLLLQKTMVTVEGVARDLDPEINFWQAAEPVLAGWIGENLSPEARLRDAADAARGLVRQLPHLVDRAERAARILGDDAVRRDATARSRWLEAAATGGGNPWRLAFGAVVAILVLVLLIG